MGFSDDTFFFYFSGHGVKYKSENYLLLTDDDIPISTLIEAIKQICAKNVVIILDCCHSGGLFIEETPKIDIDETFEQFVGHGYAIMASCESYEESTSHEQKSISLYTSILCEALTNRFLIRQGKKSLEDINQYIFRCANVLEKNAQHPKFRSNIGGTIYFDVEKYIPYKVAEVYEETDEYIIYDVDPVHHNLAKRLSIRVILRFPCTIEQVAKIAEEIRDKAIYYDVYQNGIAERRHRGYPVNIIWCYFGYDEDDMVNKNFAYRSTWIDDRQDKKYWYAKAVNTSIINGIHFQRISGYRAIKEFNKNNTASRNEIIEKRHECTYKLINLAEQYIAMFRELINRTNIEQQLFQQLAPLNKEISDLYMEQSRFPLAPKELHDWELLHIMLANTIHDFTLFYSVNNMDKWNEKDRKFLMESRIKQYEELLEKIKVTDENISAISVG